MALKGVIGKSNDVNISLLIEACNHHPSLFIDCNNCANPHLVHGIADEKALHNVFVLQAESMYRFSVLLKELAGIINELGVNKIVISTFDHLFNFQNKDENRQMNVNLWDSIRLLSKENENVEFIAGISEKSNEHLMLAKNRCDSIISSGYYIARA